MRRISEIELRAAVERAGLGAEIFDRIHAALEESPSTGPEASPRFEAAHVSYYLGSLLIIGAMSWFVTRAWNTLSGFTIAGIAIAYGAVFGAVGFALSRRASTKIPGGLLVTVAVCMTPMVVYGLERGFGWWPALNSHPYSGFYPWSHADRLAMELATLAVAGIALRFIRFPFVTAPAAYALWCLSMDSTALIFGAQWNFHQECRISVALGLIMLIAGYLLEGVSELDFSFWLYFFGLLAFTGGLTFMGNESEVGKAIYCLIHLLLIGTGTLLRRRAFLVFGAIGVFAYLMGEAETYFRDSFGFTIALTAIGAGFIAAGIVYKRNESMLQKKLTPWIPERVRRRGI